MDPAALDLEQFHNCGAVGQWAGLDDSGPGSAKHSLFVLLGIIDDPPLTDVALRSAISILHSQGGRCTGARPISRCGTGPADSTARAGSNAGSKKPQSRTNFELQWP